MADIVTPDKRSKMMAGIKSTNTKPELAVRKALFRLGFRYRIHDKNLPGKPDLVLKKHNAVILVNGCFWHGHDCHKYRPPKTRTDYWVDKIGKNKARDERNESLLSASGWRICIIWECALSGSTSLEEKDTINMLENWLNSNNLFLEIKGSTR